MKNPTTSPTCKVCNLPAQDRHDVEVEINKGLSLSKVAAFMLTRGCHATPRAVNTHRHKHMGVTEAVKALIAKSQASQELVATEVAARVADASGLDEVFSIAREVALQLKPKILSGSFSMQEAMIFKWMLVEMREAVVSKSELVDGKRLNISDTDGLFGFLAIGHTPGSRPTEARTEDDDGG
jgi:hypothetical protein